MAGYTKADFLSLYKTYVDADGHTMYQFRNDEVRQLVDFNEQTGITLALHYHPEPLQNLLEAHADKYIQHFIDQGTPLTATSSVLLIGGAFGWTGEILEERIPGLECITVDTSDYVQTTKDGDLDDDLIEAIQASGYDHTLPNSVGEWLFNKFSQPGRPRTRSQVLQNDLSSNRLRNELRRTFQRSEITHVITEEVWQLLTPEERDRYTTAATAYGAELAHIIDGIIA